VNKDGCDLEWALDGGGEDDGGDRFKGRSSLGVQLQAQLLDLPMSDSSTYAMNVSTYDGNARSHLHGLNRYGSMFVAANVPQWSTLYIQYVYSTI
jgi:hypothetical protein